jgi:Rhs element Vgr protein
MTAPSPLASDVELATFSIKVEGKAIPSEWQVVSIDTSSCVNKVPKARLVLFDGSAAEEDFKISDEKTFLPGNNVEIAAGYEGKNATIFKGVIVKQGLEINRTTGSKLIVDLTDVALKMTLERNSAIFEKMKDSDVIEKLISANGLAKDVAATSVVYEDIVQYYVSDWDLMLTRAELNSYVVIVAGGKVTVKKPDTSQSPVLRVVYGESIMDLQAEMDSATQYDSSAIKSYSWDAASQKLIEAGPGSVTVKEQGNVSSSELAKVFGVKKLDQQTGGAVEMNSLKDWSSAELLKSKLSKIRGDVTFQGSSLALTGKTIELGGLGERFDGVAFISGVHHRISEGIWLTTVSFGLSSQWFAATAPMLAAPGASGQLPPIKGLQTGIVKQVAKDPAKEFRVLVNLPLLQDSSKNIWARLGTFYASKDCGDVFYPEVDDEVIVGFMNEDPRYPVILGSVYSKTIAPPYPPDDKNTKKAVRTKAKLEILFDDQDKVIEIKTPGTHVIRMSDKDGSISIEDSNKNKVTLSKSGIDVESASNLKINAKGNITVQAGGNLSLGATGNTSVEGLEIANKAKTKFSANGTVAAEVTASGMLTIRGALVKIN